jgi:iron complex transport system substrate-binding protein
VAAVSQFADDPSYSFVADTASTRPSYRQVRAETVLKFDPDLVILTRYTRADIRRKIRNLDIPVILTGTVNTKADIVRNTRLIGRAVGKTDAADSWIDHMDERLAQFPDRSGVVDVLYYTMSGTVPGKETLPDLILQSAGLQNNAAEAGIRGWKVMAPEQILDTPPDSFIFQDRNHEEVVEKLRNDPALNSLDAVRKGRFRSAEPKYLTVASPYIYRAVDYWRNQFRENPDAPS